MRAFVGPALVFLFVLIAILSAVANAKTKAATSGGGNAGFDHRAHAVPGGPYSVLDSYDVGYAYVKLSGANSHTHFFNPSTGEVGRVTRFEWRSGGRVVCQEMKCAAKFKRGTHRVVLTVWDSTGDVARASTAVYVLAPTRPGLRILFYPNRALFPNQNSGRPAYSATKTRLDMFTLDKFPRFLLRGPFSARVLTAIDFPYNGVYSLKIWCGGADCNLFVGARRVTQVRYANGGNAIGVTLPLFSRKGRKRVEIVYVRRSAKWRDPALVLWWRPQRSKDWEVVPSVVLSRNPAAYPPVIHHVDPSSAAVGSVISLVGSSFIDVQKVTLGSNECVAVEVASEHRLTCVVPGGTGHSNIRVHVGSGKKSNFERFTIVAPGAQPYKKRGVPLSGVPPGKPLESQIPTKRGRVGISADPEGANRDDSMGPMGYYQPIEFDKEIVKSGNGKTFTLKQMTAVVVGPDLKYYIGSLNGFVHVVEIDSNYVVRNHCKSNNIGYRRSILGLAFNPADFPSIKLYASTNVLDWHRKRLLPFEKGWKNGQIIMFEPYNKGGVCLVKTGHVITGLPVSNHDHGVNSIHFNSWGSLLISSGGGTNAGVSVPTDFLGGVPDSPLSGAMLIAPVSQKGYNGHIKYNSKANPAKAVQTGGNVHVYASGLRNCMGHTLHSNGKIYATDNGSNKKYGARSNTCFTSSPAYQEPDSLKLVAKGAYLGYANRNRGRWDGRQCRHRGPTTGGHGWQKPLTILESSTNGVLEYTANTFGAQMRGDLLATKFAISVGGRTYRIQLNDKGTVKSKSTLAEHSGLTLAMHPRGGLIMPRVYAGVIAALIPREKNPQKITVTTVSPLRGPKRGGMRATITGWNLYPPLKVRFGNKNCAKPADFTKDGRSFTCIVPPGTGKVPVVVSRADGGTSRTYGWEFWYMDI